jgi:hypothetical protein
MENSSSSRAQTDSFHLRQLVVGPWRLPALPAHDSVERFEVGPALALRKILRRCHGGDFLSNGHDDELVDARSSFLLSFSTAALSDRAGARDMRWPSFCSCLYPPQCLGGQIEFQCRKRAPVGSECGGSWTTSVRRCGQLQTRACSAHESRAEIKVNSLPCLQAEIGVGGES